MVCNILIALAVLPGFFLMYKIYNLDKIEKEPIGLLLKLFFLEALALIPVALVEFLLMQVTNIAFAGDTTSVACAVVENFFCVAVVEELAKFIVLKACTWKNKAFDYRFDAVVYAVSVGLGFAIFENIGYVLLYGFATAIVRALTAVPAHTIFAIFMGHFYGLAKQAHENGNETGKNACLIVSYALPVILHGIYDFCASDSSIEATIVFLIFVIACDIIAYIQVKKYSREDMKIVQDEMSEIVE